MESRTRFKADTPVQLPPAIDPVRERYPFCIVWSPIPVLSWILPFVGHTAVCDSQGRIYDFQGAYRIGQDRMLFGNPVKYWDVSRDYIPSFYNADQQNSAEREEAVKREVAAYDAALMSTISHFRQTEVYNFFTNNCHSFVAASMNEQQLKKQHMGMVSIAIGMMTRGRYISVSRFMQAHLPSILLIVIILILVALL
ncbi:conserved hypothetical protein [Leishmania major strain Friedlin]|uniref:Uncharacterized protein n=1 Tax=Leishmania major TaxID=5664 RepID=E9AD67_LEIMA|nr:conserved hypothetical protein [Leishmania major strain Friedlin]CAG9576692.1 Protein_of_unknown_function_(DUF778)_-_putative [Leishmania major strain Friedlin]CBZ12152.1 conserved hypothetical protein [Leishmania major strain Friedlin]|eukprot:XP_003721896.1 conserved hypothetical protein [Leishmania major strain Friedlin]